MCRFKLRAAFVALTATVAVAVPATALATNVTVWSVMQDRGLGVCTAAAPLAGVGTVLYDGHHQTPDYFGSYLSYGHETFGVDLAWYKGINIPSTWEFIRPPGHYLLQEIPASQRVALYSTVNHQYLAEGNQTFGIDLVWSTAPRYQWQVANGGDPSNPCNGDLYNDAENAYLIDHHQTFGVDLGWIHSPFSTGPAYIPPKLHLPVSTTASAPVSRSLLPAKGS